MNFLKIFDAYSLRARLAPSILAAAPAISALMLLVSWKTLEISNTLATLAIFVLLIAIADVARAKGRAVENQLFEKNGGMPSIVLFRRNDVTIDERLKERYRKFLSEKIGEKFPSAEDELSDQLVADAFYDRCGVWLRQNTRDTKKFPLLFGENITYGFRRNLYGLKWLAICLNLITIATCTVLFSLTPIGFDSEQGKRIAFVLLVAAIHMIYMLFAARQLWVLDAANAYGRELILSCEAFLGTSAKSKKKLNTEDVVSR